MTEPLSPAEEAEWRKAVDERATFDGFDMNLRRLFATLDRERASTRPSREALVAALRLADDVMRVAGNDRWHDEDDRYGLRENAMAVQRLDALPPAEVAEDPSRATADALLVWYDTTHGDELGHDHHCPVTGSNDPETRCTCGWTGVVKADAARGATR